MLANRMRAAVGVFEGVVVVLMRAGFRGAEIVAEGQGGNKEEEKEEGEEKPAGKRFEGGRIHGCGVVWLWRRCWFRKGTMWWA